MMVICLPFIQKNPQNNSFPKMEVQLPVRQDKAKTLTVMHRGGEGKDASYSQENTTEDLLSGINQEFTLVGSI